MKLLNFSELNRTDGSLDMMTNDEAINLYVVIRGINWIWWPIWSWFLRDKLVLWDKKCRKKWLENYLIERKKEGIKQLFKKWMLKDQNSLILWLAGGKQWKINGDSRKSSCFSKYKSAHSGTYIKNERIRKVTSDKERQT